MTKDEINDKILLLAASMNAKHVKYANARCTGKTQTESLAIAGYAPNTPNASRIEQRDDVIEFMELKKQLVAEKAQEELEYTELDWMRNQLEILRKSMGKESITLAVKSIDKDGKVTYDNVEISGEDLAQANRAQELLGKKLGILTDVNKLKAGDGVTFNMSFGG